MKKEHVRIDIVKGVYGFAIYINDFRVAGQKPWGGGEIVKTWQKIDVKDILTALGLNVEKPNRIDFSDKNDNG